MSLNTLAWIQNTVTKKMIHLEKIHTSCNKGFINIKGTVKSKDREVVPLHGMTST